MVQVTGCLEDYRGTFWIDGRIGKKRFVAWKNQKHEWKIAFFPYDPDFKPFQAFGKKGMEELKQAIRQVWKRETGQSELMQGTLLLEMKEPATGRQA